MTESVSTEEKAWHLLTLEAEDILTHSAFKNLDIYYKREREREMGYSRIPMQNCTNNVVRKIIIIIIFLFKKNRKN